MFFRVKSAGAYPYLQIVHSVRRGEKVRQQVFGTLGRLDELKASGRLEALIRSEVRHCEKFALIDAHAAGETGSCHGAAHRAGPGLWAALERMRDSGGNSIESLEAIREADALVERFENRYSSAELHRLVVCF